MQDIEDELAVTRDALSDIDKYEEPHGEAADDLLDDDAQTSKMAKLTAELENLKRQLEEQQDATLDMARQAAEEAYRVIEQRKELEKARAEAEKARSESEKIRLQAAAAAQMASVEMLRIEREYSNSKQQRIASKKPLSHPNKRAAGAVETEPAKKPKNRKRGRWLRLAGKIVGLLSISALAAVLTIWAVSHQVNGRSQSAVIATRTKKSSGSAAEIARAIEQSSIADGLEPDDPNAGSPFLQSVDRLSRAFDSFPDKQPSEIVNEVNGRGSSGLMSCPMEWNSHGEPAFLLGQGPQPRISIIRVIDDCASLVERYRMKTLRLERQKGS